MAQKQFKTTRGGLLQNWIPPLKNLASSADVLEGTAAACEQVQFKLNHLCCNSYFVFKAGSASVACGHYSKPLLTRKPTGALWFHWHSMTVLRWLCSPVTRSQTPFWLSNCGTFSCGALTSLSGRCFRPPTCWCSSHNSQSRDKTRHFYQLDKVLI